MPRLRHPPRLGLGLRPGTVGNWDLETGGEVEEQLCGEINPLPCPAKRGRGTSYSTPVTHKHRENEEESVSIPNLKAQKDRALPAEQAGRSEHWL